MPFRDFGHLIAIGCAMLAIFVGLSACVGWFTQSYWLAAYTENLLYPSMKFNTALCLIASGGAIIGFKLKHKLAMNVLASFSLLIFSIALLENLTNTMTGLDELFISDDWAKSNPGRMPTAAAITGILGNLSLFLLRHAKTNDKLVALLLLCFCIIPTFSLLTYIFQSRPEYLILSISSTIGFISFAIALIVSCPSQGYLGLWLRSDGPSRSFRHATIIIISCLTLSGYLFSKAQNYSVFSTNIGYALLSATAIFLSIIVIAQNTQRISLWFEKLQQQNETTDKLESALFEILEMSTEGILIVDVSGAIVHANSGCESIFGWSKNELTGKPIEILIPERFREDHLGLVRRFTANPETTRGHNLKGNIIAFTKSGEEKPVAISLNKQTSNNANRYLVAVVREKENTKSETEAIQSITKIDSLTGTLSREEFDSFCDQINQGSFRRSGDKFCLMLIDIDYFKVINEKFGREAGNAVLINFAKILKQNLRASDKLFRFQGEEFALFSKTTNPNEALLVAERIRTSVKISPTHYEDEKIYITCSIGVTVTDEKNVNIENQIQQIQQAMAGAKKLDRDQVITLN